MHRASAHARRGLTAPPARAEAGQTAAHRTLAWAPASCSRSGGERGRLGVPVGLDQRHSLCGIVHKRDELEVVFGDSKASHHGLDHPLPRLAVAENARRRVLAQLAQSRNVPRNAQLRQRANGAREDQEVADALGHAADAVQQAAGVDVLGQEVVAPAGAMGKELRHQEPLGNPAGCLRALGRRLHRAHVPPVPQLKPCGGNGFACRLCLHVGRAPGLGP
mmetsp:Transcript_18362/g.69512  ORF Transcript_18362/g.69512 Transcript_18362/m.69512 type:complete len:220 (-) Transcript_18362:136-795(-)